MYEPDKDDDRDDNDDRDDIGRQLSDSLWGEEE